VSGINCSKDLVVYGTYEDCECKSNHDGVNQLNKGAEMAVVQNAGRWLGAQIHPACRQTRFVSTQL
jgi:hypothetical protein